MFRPVASKRTLHKVNWNRFRNQATYNLLMLPAVLLLLVFNYAPMAGLVMAFQRYIPTKGIFGSKFIGLDHFIRLFSSSSMGQVIFNTVFISLMKITAGILVPVMFALLLNELRAKTFVRTVQTMIYVPNFLSWVILSGIILEVLSPSTGVVNNLIKFFGMEPIYFLGDATLFPYMLVITDTWKSFGYGTIIYLAALTSIDPSLYEAATVDGASHTQQLRHITLPGITSVIVLMTVLSLGNLLNAGFDQVFNLINPTVYKTGEILDLTVYNIGIRQSNFSLATAVGLFKSIISFALIVLSYKLAKKYAGYRIF